LPKLIGAFITVFIFQFTVRYCRVYLQCVNKAATFNI